MQPDNNKFTSKEREIVLSHQQGAQKYRTWAIHGSLLLTEVTWSATWGHAVGTNTPCSDMQCDSMCGLTIVWLHEGQRGLPLPIHPSLRKTEQECVTEEKQTDDTAESWLKKHTMWQKNPKRQRGDKKKKERQKREQSNERVKKSNQS